MQRQIQDLDADQKDGHFHNYADYSRTLRAWLVAYGVGGPVLLLTNDTVAAKVAASGHGRAIIFAFLLGVGLQILLALINKWGAWHMYVGAGDSNYQRRTRYTAWGFVNRQSWVDIILDISSIGAFTSATWWVLNILLNPRTTTTTLSQHNMSNSDLIAVSSAIIALSALGISVWQGFLTRRHNRLSSKPFLEVDIVTSEQQGVALRLRNVGLGPAILQGLRVTFSGTTFDMMDRAEFKRLLVCIMPPDQSWEFQSMHMRPGSVISAGEVLNVFELKTNPRLADVLDFSTDYLHSLRVVADYECMYARSYSKTEVHGATSAP